LKELYDLNGIEFTCTAVDLDDKILRLFNHKTAPNLPVCKAIQLSGSFPVAFQSQKWEKSWGKYYVHYINTRKEIDLSGHMMTDGGLLANFPIKYIDNEEMRPMYFSHQKNPKNTILYGFGLEQIEEKVNRYQEKYKEEATLELKEHIQSKISKFSLLANLIMSDSSVEL
jgi:predicted acylesterase/phospholipase RssA